MSRMEKSFLKHIGTKIKSLRKSKNLSQEKFAEKIMMSRNALGSIERGETNVPILTLYKIFKEFDIDLKNLFD